MAEGNIYLDLTEEIQEGLKTAYQSLCDELGANFAGMRSELEELCRATSYKPMVDTVNETVRRFDEDIHQLSMRVFQEWQDSDGSFQAVATHSQAGEEALDTARQMENALHEILETFWGNKYLGDVMQIDTSRPVVKSEDFDVLKDIYQKHSNETQEIGEQSIRQINENGENNPTYHVIIPVIKAVAEPIKNAFAEFTGKIEKAKADSDSLRAAQEAKNQEAAEAATNTSASARDIAESLEMFRDV